MLNEVQAEQLAQALAEHSLTGQALARRIRLEAGGDAKTDRRHVDPTKEELRELVAVLSECQWPPEEDGFERLRLEALRALRDPHR